jgi:predicted nucleic acid-binding Zn ribbon protein
MLWPQLKLDFADITGQRSSGQTMTAEVKVPKYYYETNDGDIFEIFHSINVEKFTNFYDMNAYSKQNDLSRMKNVFQETDLSYFENEEQQKNISLRRIIQLPSIQFKGGGWFSAHTKFLRYPGKNKKLYEQLREERSRRRSKNLTVTDLDRAIGINSKAVDGIVPDKKWEAMTKEQKSIANEYGIRPSKHYSK